MKRLTILLVCLLTPGTAWAQTSAESDELPPPAQLASGLGSVEIEPIEAAPGIQVTQDQQGFMWFGGRDGLYRYDGYDFIRYHNDPDDSTSLGFDFVSYVYVDRQGTLWVGTYGGLDRFDRETDTFTHYRHDADDPTSLSDNGINTILEDRRGTLWVGTGGGLDRLDRETGSFTHYRHDPADPTSLSNDQVRVLYEDSFGTLWIGTGQPDLPPISDGGLNRFDPLTDTFTRYLHDPQDEKSLINNRIMSLYEDSRGAFYVGTQGDGLHTMDREAGTFTRLRYDPEDPTKLSRPVLIGTSKVEEGCASWDCGGVTFIHEDKPGMLWIGALGGGINRYDPFDLAQGTGVMNHYESATSSLVNDAVWDMFESYDGTLWITSWGAEHKVFSPVNAFPHYAQDPRDPGSLGGSHVKVILEDRTGKIWIGTGSGLDRFDRKTGTFTHFRHDTDDPTSLPSNSTRSLYEDRAGGLWVGHDRGGSLSRYDLSTEHFIQFLPDLEDPTSLSSSWVWSLLEDRQGRLWVGTWGSGLDLFDPATGGFEHFRHDPDDPGTISNNTVTVLYEDEAGTLWVGSENGLSRLDHGPEDAAFTSYLSGRIITSIYEDGTGRFWVGTWGDGLHRLDHETGQSTRYGPEEGLASVNIASLVEDDEGYLWISTAEGHYVSPIKGGLSRLDFETGTFTNFGPRDGLPDIGFSSAAVLKSRDGMLFFGGNRGFTVFDPKTIREPLRWSPKMALTSLRVFNDEVRPGPAAPLKAPIHVAREIRLPYDQNDFTIDYAALVFRDPDQIQYNYQLEGHDTGWVSARTQRSARYSGLDPGSYLFRVRAVNSLGLWSEEEASIRVVVLPPWWRTTWAYLLYGVLLATGMFTAYRVQRRRLIHQERHRAMVRELEQAKEIEAMNQRLRAHEQQLETQNALLAEQKQRLVELDELKSRFFANISHEFRSPLTLILGPLGDALSGSYGPVPHRLRTQLHLMQRSGLRLLELISQLLDLSRLESGSMVLRARRLDLIPFLHGLVVAFAARAEREHITLQFAADAETCPLYFEADKLEKVFTNLLSNAFKFTPEHGKIRVSVEGEEAGDAVAVAVRDTGQGIPREELPRVFDRFYQVDASLTRRHEGAGIGLSLARELVELHGGTITVESMPGFGTTFTVRLPLGRAHLRAEQIVEAGEEAPPLEDMVAQQAASLPEAHDLEAELDEEVTPPEDAPCVLVVDDNADVRAYLRGHLEQYYRVAEAADGLDGLETARTLEPDLIIADVMMPRMDGFMLCEALKADPHLNHVPVLLLTAKVDAESKITGLQEGAEDYLTKPFDAKELLLRVERLLEVRRNLRERYSGEVTLKPNRLVVSSAEAAFLEQVRRTIDQHMNEADFNVGRLADEVGLSIRQLQRRLQEVAHMSSADIIRKMRLERAAQLLEDKAGTVSEIAYAVGFKNAQHFSRLFRKTFGMSPSAYAAAHAES